MVPKSNDYVQKQPPEVLCIKKSVLKDFAKLTEKHLYQSLFFDKVAVLRSATLTLFRMGGGKKAPLPVFPV